MRLPVKLSLLLAAATCFPLLLATAFTLPRGREALRSQLDEIYAQDARALAAEVHRSLVDKLDSLTLAASTLRLNELDPEAREQALLLIYKETRGADIVGLFDARADAVGNIIRFPRLQGVLASEHEAIDDAALSSYARKVPLQGALQAGLAIGPVYVVPDVRGRPIPRLVLAVAVPGTPNTRWVVAVEISLRRLAVTAGALETHVDVRRRDELGELADAFNTMTRGLREREALKATLALSETLELKQVLERLLDSLARAVPFQEASILVETRDAMDVVVSRGARGKDESHRLVPNSAHVERAVTTLQPAVNDGWQMMALPLIRRGVVIGVVCLESNRPYTEADVRLAQSLTQPAAMAVENARLFDEVQRLATLDGLTSTYNRRHFMDLAQLQYDNARRFGHPLTAMMLDVDHFKRINDRHGHHVGDQVLRALAERCRRALRSVDVLGRYGGEEFAIVLPGTTQHNAATVLAERIRKRVADEPIKTDDGAVKVTVSVGVAELDAEMRGPEDLLKRADAALYEAKQAVRNRVVEDAVA